MKKIKLLVMASLSLALSLPALGKTYKDTYPVPCSEVWGAVKDALNNPANYADVQSDDAQMKASYEVKHSAHVNISGALLQRTNRVTLISKGTVCEMQVISNYSGWEHNDRGDFKQRVDESLAKQKAAASSQPTEAAVPTK